MGQRKKGVWEREGEKEYAESWGASYLAFDIDFLESSISGRLEEPQGLAGEQPHLAFTFFKE